MVICLGDARDFYALSSFSKKADLITPKGEFKRGTERLNAMWSRIHGIVPKARLVSLSGNHEARLEKRVHEKLPEVSSLLEGPAKALFNFKKVEVLYSHRAEIILKHPIHGEITIVHGWSSRVGSHMAHFHTSTVHGHTHRAHVLYRGGRKTIWEMNCGCLVNEMSLPLSYGDTATTGWVKAIGWLDDKGPRVILI